MQYVSDNIGITCFTETHKKWSQTSQKWQKIRLFTYWQVFFFPSFWFGTTLCFYLGVIRLCKNCKNLTYSIQAVLHTQGETNTVAPALHREAPTVPWVIHRLRLRILEKNKTKQKDERRICKISSLFGRFNSSPVWFTVSTACAINCVFPEHIKMCTCNAHKQGAIYCMTRFTFGQS